MQDKISRKILRFMSEKDAGTLCSVSENWDEYSAVSLSELCSAVGADEADVLPAIDYLVSKGLARYQSLKSRQGPVNIAFALKHEGLHYKEFRRLTAIERWKERLIGFFSGVAVTVIGGLILEWLSK